MIGKRGVSVALKEKHQGNIWGDGIFLNLDCVGGYKTHTCVKMSWNTYCANVNFLVLLLCPICNITLFIIVLSYYSYIKCNHRGNYM